MNPKDSGVRTAQDTHFSTQTNGTDTKGETDSMSLSSLVHHISHKTTMSFRKPPPGAPKGYVPGLGRGAAGFTTRSDIGPAASQSEGPGSRSAAARFGAAPQGYVPGAGRGAGRPAGQNDGPTGYDAFEGYQERRTNNDEEPYEQDDEEADNIYAAVEERMKRKRKEREGTDEEKKTARQKIGAQFRELKEKLADVTEEQWASIPDVGDYRYVSGVLQRVLFLGISHGYTVV